MGMNLTSTNGAGMVDKRFEGGDVDDKVIHMRLTSSERLVAAIYHKWRKPYYDIYEVYLPVWGKIRPLIRSLQL